MCGISGIINWSKISATGELTTLIEQMNSRLAHRGPDDSGTWVDIKKRNAFGHRRLSIQDLSSQGKQPFLDKTENHLIVFNGEIYNFLELRKELELLGISFQSNTDTEVLLEALKLWGVEALQKLDGMFAFAYHDIKKNKTLLARDPFGEKPLYWAQPGSSFVFASELTALLDLPGLNPEVGSDAISTYLFLQYLDSPQTIFNNVNQLEPGSWMVLNSGIVESRGRYFSFNPQEKKAEENTVQDLDSLADELEDILVRSLQRRLIADVPIGAFLSGGIDSALIAALICKKIGYPLHTFSIGFSDTSLSEHNEARKTAEFLGCTHHEKILSPDELSHFSHIVAALDEPNADTSCLPYYFLAEFARKKIKVAISGDGADELFGGYSRYVSMLATHKNNNYSNAGASYYNRHLSVWREDQFLETLFDTPDEFFQHRDNLYCEIDCSNLGIINRLRQADINHYLPGSVLAKVDRMSMAHGLEVRTPFLTQELARFTEKLPEDALVKGSTGKIVLRHLAKRYLPESWVNRQKMGFSLPNDPNWASALKRKINLITEHDNKQWFNIEKALTNSDDGNLFQVWSLLVLNNYSQLHPAEAYVRNNQYKLEKTSNTGTELSTGKTRNSTSEYSALLFDTNTDSFLPFNSRHILDDLYQHLHFTPAGAKNLEQHLQKNNVALLRKDTPKRAFRLLGELFTAIKSYHKTKQRYLILHKIINQDNLIKTKISRLQRITFIMHDLASGGAERQLCMNAIAAREAGMDVHVLILWPLTGNNVHYLSLLKEQKIPVSSCAYPHKKADQNYLKNSFDGDRGEFMDSLPKQLQQPLWNLTTHLSVIKPDCLHCFVDIACLLGGLSTILSGIPRAIFSFRNKNPTHFSFSQPWLKSFYKELSLSQRICLTGNSLAGNNDYAAWIGIPEKSILLIRNGLMLDDWTVISDDEKITARSSLAVPADTLCILGVFQLEHYKRPLYFLDVIKKIKDNTKIPFIVLVAGDGQLKSIFQLTIHRLGLSKTVIYLGRRKNIQELLAASDIMLFTSGFGEGTPNVLIEAQARGIPVVTTEAGGGACEAIAAEESGFILKEDDINGLALACEKLMSSHSLRHMMSHNAVKFIKENYTFDILKENLIRLYREL